MTPKEEILEATKDNKLFLRLVIDGKMMCGAEIFPYSCLLDITTTLGEEEKGYAKKLLTYVEKIAKEHKTETMKTDDIDPCNYKIVCLLKSMGYRFHEIKHDERKFIEATKNL